MSTVQPVYPAVHLGEGGWRGGGREDEGPGGDQEGGGEAQGIHPDPHQVSKHVG